MSSEPTRARGKSMRRQLSILVASLAAVAGLASPAMATGAPPHVSDATLASAAYTGHHAAQAKRNFTNGEIFNDASGAPQGGDGGGNVVDGSHAIYTGWNGVLAGYVTNNGSSSWPFDVGSGDNATYAGRPVWVFILNADTSKCMQVAFVGVVTNTTCGSGHDGRLWVSTYNAPDGRSGHHGLVNVYETDYGYEHQSTPAEYMYIPGPGYQDQWANYNYGDTTESYSF